MVNDVDPRASHTIEVHGGADPSLVTYTHAVYALHALSVLIGITGPATIVGSFVFGLPSIIAVIMNYVRRSDAAGTYLETHFRWQIRTFWLALLWMILAALVSAPLILLFGLGFLTLFLAAVLIGLWVVYRIGRGWLALKDGRAIVD
ncbi:MAG TPA: hypothetical protein VEC57_11560 [Candidatus Limnocylindrales bacterium]|nr:hypothetical protein [Candidatus Limnocylindrales bacterium]